MSKDQQDKPKTASPLEWCKALGKFDIIRLPLGENAMQKQMAPHWQHACADALHGWTPHLYNEGAPIQLSERDYLEALAAVERGHVEFSCGKFGMLPHATAASKHGPHGAKLPKLKGK